MKKLWRKIRKFWRDLLQDIADEDYRRRPGSRGA